MADALTQQKVTYWGKRQSSVTRVATFSCPLFLCDRDGEKEGRRQRMMGDCETEGGAADFQRFPAAHLVISSGEWWNKQLLWHPTRDCCVLLISPCVPGSQQAWQNSLKQAGILTMGLHLLSALRFSLYFKYKWCLCIWHCFNMCIFWSNCPLRAVFFFFLISQKKRMFKTRCEDESWV